MASNGVSPPPFREALVERGPLTLTSTWQRWLTAFMQSSDRIVTETGLWRWSTALSGAPASGDVAVNSADYMAATEVRINKTTRPGADVSAVLDRLRVGDDLRIQQSNDASRTGLYRVTALPTNQGTWLSIPVQASSWGGLTIANNQDVVVTFGLHTGGSGGSTQPPLAGTGLADKVTLWQGASTLTYDGLLHYDRVQHWLGVGTATPAATLHVVGTTQVGALGVGYAPPSTVWLYSGGASLDSLRLGGGDIAPRWSLDCPVQGHIQQLGVYYGPDAAATSGVDFRTRYAHLDYLGVGYTVNTGYSIRSGGIYCDGLTCPGYVTFNYLVGVGGGVDARWNFTNWGTSYFSGTSQFAGVTGFGYAPDASVNIRASSIFADYITTNGAIDTRFGIRCYASIYCDGIPYSGNPGPWQAYSDRRMKHNIQPIPQALETMTRLRGVLYEWDKPEEHGNRTGVQMGVIAQEVAEVLPGWVGELSGFKTTQLSAFEALSIEAVKELATRVEKIRFRLSQFLGTPL